MSKNTLIILAIFIIADSFRLVIVRDAFLEGAEVWSFILASALVSLITMSLTTGFKYRQEVLNLIKTPKSLSIVLAINTWHFGLAGTLHILACKYVSAPEVAMIIQFVILFTTLWERIFFKEKQKKSFWILLAGNLIGLYLIVNPGKDFQFNYYFLIPLAAAFCFSITDNFSRYYLNQNLVRPGIMALFRPVGFLIFMPILFVINLFINLQLDFSKTFDSEFILYALLAGISMSIVWTYLNKAYSMTSVSNICMVAMTKPILILLISALYLNEYFNLTQSIGAVIIIISSLFFIYSKKQS